MIATAAIVLASCTSGGGGTSTAPTASPLKERIAFDRMTGATSYEGSYFGTIIANADGTGEQPLPVPKGWSGPASPVRSPDGSKLLNSVSRSPDGIGPVRAAIIRPDGSGARLLAPGKLDAGMRCSAWSPGGSRLLCSVDSGHWALDRIYSTGADGTGLTPLTHSPYHDTLGAAGECGGGDSEAGYSPDGTRFVFMRKQCGTRPHPSRDEAGALYVANTNSTGLHRITAYGQADSHPGASVRWSPDGTKILFASQDHHLYLVHPDGSALTKATSRPGTPRARHGHRRAMDQLLVLAHHRSIRRGGPPVPGPAGRHASHQGVEHAELGLPRQLGPATRTRPPQATPSRPVPGRQHKDHPRHPRTHRRPPGAGVTVPRPAAEHPPALIWFTAAEPCPSRLAGHCRTVSQAGRTRRSAITSYSCSALPLRIGRSARNRSDRRSRIQP
jgi:hypothetical protein